MAARYLAVLDGITPACAEPGPFVYAVSAGDLRSLDLPERRPVRGEPPSRDEAGGALTRVRFLPVSLVRPPADP
jgi:hypothetical protein